MDREPYSAQLVRMRDDLQSTETRIGAATTRNSHTSTAKLQKRSTELKDKIEDIKGRKESQSKSFKELKLELIGNIDKYKESLAFYATSRYTSSDARKKAREFCRKYGINYTEWVRNRIKDSGHDVSEFIL
jgi:predicted  nucleic acid-binding Zn-ribbon protein